MTEHAPVADITWADDMDKALMKLPVSRRIEGYNLYLPAAKIGRATFNRNLGEPLEGQYITWGAVRQDDGQIKLGFRISLKRDNDNRAWLVKANQVYAGWLRRMDIPEFTRIWFEYDSKRDIFIETRRETKDPILQADADPDDDDFEDD